MIGLRSKRLITDSIIYIVLTVMVVIWLFPLVWMVLRAFDTNTSNITTSIFPKEFTMDNFKNLFGGVSLRQMVGKYADSSDRLLYNFYFIGAHGFLRAFAFEV